MNDKRILILYNSKRGSTKQYADWIEDGVRTSCDEDGIGVKIDKVRLDDFDFDELPCYDAVVFGSWLRGSGIVGFSSIKSYLEEIQDRVIIYCTGISDYNPENYLQIAEINFNDKVDLREAKLYYCPGAYHPEKVKGMDRFMMWIAKKILIKGTVKEDRDAGQRMKRIIEEGADLKDEKYARQVVQAVMNIIKG